MEFTKEILARVKTFYKENEKKSKRVFIMQKFWGEIWYMSTLLVITFDRKIALMQGLWHWKLDFNNFPMVYYMPNFDNRARNDDCLNFAKIVSVKRRLGFLVVEVATESALASGFPCNLIQLLYFCIILFFFISSNFLGFI